MKKVLVITLFMLATLAWASAQQPGSNPSTSSGQATSPSSQVPDASQSQPSTPGSTDTRSAVNAPVTEGCLGGSDPNYTITDKAGTTYKLNIPPNANTSTLAQHVGESVKVAGDLNDTNKANASINVQGIARGTGTCPSSGEKSAPPPPKQ